MQKRSQTPHSSLEIPTTCEDVILLDDLGLSFPLSIMKPRVRALYMLRIAINNSSVIINDKTMMWVWMTSRVLCSSAIYDSQFTFEIEGKKNIKWFKYVTWTVWPALSVLFCLFVFSEKIMSVSHSGQKLSTDGESRILMGVWGRKNWEGGMLVSFLSL